MDSASPSNSSKTKQGTVMWKAAGRVLTESVKEKLLCVILHSDLTFKDVNWEDVTAAYGAKNVKTMRKHISSVIKKIKDSAASTPEETEAATPVTPARRKRIAVPGDDAEISMQVAEKRASNVKAEPMDEMRNSNVVDS